MNTFKATDEAFESRHMRTSRRLTTDESIVELVEVLAALDDDLHRAGDAGKLARARIGHDSNREVLGAAVDDACVVERERAFLSIQRAAHALDGDVHSGVFDGRRHGRQHFALAGTNDRSEERRVGKECRL